MSSVVQSPTVVNAPYDLNRSPTLFLAGGITDCPWWQSDMIELLNGLDLIVLNPRQENFDVTDPNASVKQITWEYNYLEEANAILFWFPKETLCPIVLFELGRWSYTNKKIFVGTHPEYERRDDVDIQMGLSNPGLVVVRSLEMLAEQVDDWLYHRNQISDIRYR